MPSSVVIPPTRPCAVRAVFRLKGAVTPDHDVRQTFTREPHPVRWAPLASWVRLWAHVDGGGPDRTPREDGREARTAANRIRAAVRAAPAPPRRGRGRGRPAAGVLAPADPTRGIPA